MRESTRVTIEHIVASSDRSYEQVKASLEAQLGELGNTEDLVQQLLATKVSWEQVTQAIEKRLGTSGFSIFSKVEQGQLLAVSGKPQRVIQYAIGNPLLAIKMIEHAPEVALYAPLRLAVYEGEQGGTFVTYDRFTSLLAPYRRPEITATAALVERKLEELVAAAIGETNQQGQ